MWQFVSAMKRQAALCLDKENYESSYCVWVGEVSGVRQPTAQVVVGAPPETYNTLSCTYGLTHDAS